MEIARTKAEIRRLVGVAKKAGQTVGFVATLGALHGGHMSLIERARKETDFVVVSIFLNPTQFGPDEDLDEYPRQEEKDLALCEKAGVDVVFAPSVEQMYPSGHCTVVKIEGLSEKLCGANRPGFFAGVSTVVAKLFNIVEPDIAYFGQKDAQQGLIIKRMVEELDMPIEIRMCQTVREEEGLAMSSRNAYLDAKQRKQANCLYQALQEGKKLIEGGQVDRDKVTAAMERVITQAGPCSIDYVAAVDSQSLEPATAENRSWLLALAVRIGRSRLIDNIVVEIPGPS
ncbi:MAG: pantoate--beta-alanine ligase [Phycisphaerae bacterium]|nr:pantoate--beta-alanine ligase [Phycisphaerae bacterium]